ncbi:LysE family translocator [Yoonia sp.]|uniref:LysE family translocator n=1 Tax=Yoonia sp. TaxID=2212373 RepID=UPI0035C83615
MFEIVSPTVLFGFSVIWLAAAMTPGANVAFTVSVSSRYGFRAGLMCAAGFVTGVFIYALIVVFGLSLVAQWFGPVLAVMRWVGVVYLIWLAYKIWNAPGAGATSRAVDAPGHWQILVQAALVSLTNPKAMIFVLVVVPQAVDVTRPATPQLLVLAVFASLMSLTAHSIYSALGYMLGRAVPSQKAGVWVNRLIASILIFGAIGLSVATLPENL